MPCRDYYDDHPEEYFGEQLKNKDAEIEKLRKQISFAESALCATLAGLVECHEAHGELSKLPNSNFKNWINFNEAGITQKELDKWHKKHLELDIIHRAEEESKKSIKIKEESDKKLKIKIRRSALNKLTNEEKIALGIKITSL